MKTKIRIFTAILLIISLFSCSGSFEQKVEDSVRHQLSVYPESRLQDIYKNFFQDRFGPGHLISDTVAAAGYLREELLASEVDLNTPIIEQTGWEGNYFRVSLDVVKIGVVSEEEFMNCFIESANSAAKATPEAWKKEWSKILKIIEKMNLALPDFEADKAKIQKVLASGDFAMHHSEAFERAYHPHYRIIKREIYEQKIMPLFRNE
ncbi:MAG: hypothetical protein LBR64_03055 [Dysgonamonadaceae bacterium]|jgi:hypothetical protein|nr:hypothetical protein [Dysgonamonadaceae bacterium]